MYIIRSHDSMRDNEWVNQWMVLEHGAINTLHPLCACVRSLAQQHHNFESFRFDQLFCVFVLGHSACTGSFAIPSDSEINEMEKETTTTTKPNRTQYKQKGQRKIPRKSLDRILIF